MPASVHSLADATRKPHENADAVILHYKTINAELEAQLAVACAQRDALRELVERCCELVDAALVHARDGGSVQAGAGSAFLPGG